MFRISPGETHAARIRNGFGTLYTAIYRPDQGTVEWQWPESNWSQSFAAFREGTRTVDYTASGARVRATRGSTARAAPRTEAVRHAGRGQDGRRHDTVADPAIATRQGVHTMRTALRSAGYPGSTLGRGIAGPRLVETVPFGRQPLPIDPT